MKQARKFRKRIYVKNNFGIQSLVHKEMPFETSAYKPDLFYKMRDGYYNQDFSDDFSELPSMNPVTQKFVYPRSIIEFNYSRKYNLLDTKFLNNIYNKVLSCQDEAYSDYTFLRSNDINTFSYGTNLNCKFIFLIV
jgi:hypothetical protein